MSTRSGDAHRSGSLVFQTNTYLCRSWSNRIVGAGTVLKFVSIVATPSTSTTRCGGIGSDSVTHGLPTLRW